MTLDTKLAWLIPRACGASTRVLGMENLKIPDGKRLLDMLSCQFLDKARIAGGDGVPVAATATKTPRGIAIIDPCT